MAVRPDERGLPDQLVGATLGEPLLERVLERIAPGVRPVRADEPVAGQARELLVRERREKLYRGGARADHRAPGLHELGVPRVELGRRATPLPLLQETVPLTERPLVRAELRIAERPE